MKRLLLPLLAALALPAVVNAFPHYPFRNNSGIIKNSDIILKTDSGEKYVVKETSIKVTKFGLDEGREKASRELDNWKKSLKKCINSRFVRRSIETCTEIYDIPEHRARISSYKKDLEAETESIHFIGVKYRPIRCVDGPLGIETCYGYDIQNAERLMINLYKKNGYLIKEENQLVHLISLKFRDIFIDLDVLKEEKFYVRVGCLNPKLKEKTILFWDYYNQIRRFKGQINRSKYFTIPDETSINAYEQVKVKLCERYAKF
tara:strand:- start:79 stop:861 length:783 start_codon:yes stop_codon:yes gene_type:complete